MRKSLWNAEKIKFGFERFLKEHNRIPKATEIDKIDYLPSSRLIQRDYGGLEQLRKSFGYTDTHFGKGAARSTIANRVNTRGRQAEMTLLVKLIELFGETYVHTEKMFADFSKTRLDFYVYSPTGNFGIDVFHSDSLHTLQSNVNIKMKKYIEFQEELFIVSASEDTSQDELTRYIKAKRNPLPANVQLVTTETLLLIIKDKLPYPNPLKMLSNL